MLPGPCSYRKAACQVSRRETQDHNYSREILSLSLWLREEGNVHVIEVQWPNNLGEIPRGKIPKKCFAVDQIFFSECSAVESVTVSEV